MRVPVEEQRQAAAAKALVRAYGGIEAAADLCGKSSSQIHRYTSPTAPDSMPLRDIALLESHTHGSSGHPQVTQLLCSNAQGMFVHLPDVTDGADVMRSMAAMAKEFGETAAVVAEAAADGKIDLKEAQRIRQELIEQRRASARLLAAVEQIIEAGDAE